MRSSGSISGVLAFCAVLLASFAKACQFATSSNGEPSHRAPLSGLTASKDLTRACTGARAELSCACAPSQAACLGGNVRAAYHDLCCVRERANHPAYQVADELS